MIKRLVFIIALVLSMTTLAANTSDVNAQTYCDWASFVTDVTVPDGTILGPNTAFSKIWRLKNIGTCSWGSGYKLVYVSGNTLGGPAEIDLPKTVAPGETVDVVLPLTTPGTEGTHYSYWRIKNSAGQQFGIGSNAFGVIWVKITVNYNSTTTYPTSVPASYTSVPATVVPPSSSGLCDWAGFVADVTIPDGSILPSNQSFTKVWRLKNNGTCTWSTGYKLVYVSGATLGAASEVALPKAVALGETVDITINMTTPASAGTYFSYWRLKNTSGNTFGIGGNATGPIWLKIYVNQSAATSTGSTSTAPTATLSSPVTGSSCDLAGNVQDMTVPDNTVMQPNQSFVKIWRIKNIGTCTWTTNYKFTFVNGAQMGAPSEINLPNSVAPGQTVDVSVNMTAPTSMGLYNGYWKLKNESGQVFGTGTQAATPIWVKIYINTELGTPTATPKPTSSASYCDWATVIKDVTVPDLTVFYGGDTFVKTWRVKNIGTCTWTTGYKLIYDSGNQMSGPSEVAMPRAVAPGETIDLSVNLQAPAWSSDYIGYWRFKNAKGEVFGVGSKAISVFWVKIRVVGYIRESLPFNQLVCSAQWSTNYGPITCPSKENFQRGSVFTNENPSIEGGWYRNEQLSIVTVPPDGQGGYIMGVYPPFQIHTGDRLTTKLGCLGDSPKCDVTFELYYLDVNGGSHTLVGPVGQTTDGYTTDVEMKLDNLSGKVVQFVFKVSNNGSSVDDRALWFFPSIWRTK